MRLLLVCVGRLKASLERDLAARYLERAAAASRTLGLSIDIRELEESRAATPAGRKADEAKAIRASLPKNAKLVLLDEAGLPLASKPFAEALARLRDDGVPAVALVIGGPEGLAPELRAEADLMIAFGAMTWPHQLVRIMAAEQIYRAITILSGHPYHRD